MEGATDLSELLGGQPVQSPAFQPMVTGGGDPFSTPLNTTPHKPSRVSGILSSSISYVSCVFSRVSPALCPTCV